MLLLWLTSASTPSENWSTLPGFWKKKSLFKKDLFFLKIFCCVGDCYFFFSIPPSKEEKNPLPCNFHNNVLCWTVRETTTIMYPYFCIHTEAITVMSSQYLNFCLCIVALRYKINGLTDFKPIITVRVQIIRALNYSYFYFNTNLGHFISISILIILAATWQPSWPSCIFMPNFCGITTSEVITSMVLKLI